jgi:hypothetical protein
MKAGREQRVGQQPVKGAEPSEPACPQAVLAAAWATGNLAPAEEARYAEHLRQCPVCAGELAGFRRVVTALREAPAGPGPEPAGDWTGRILAALPPEAFRPSPWAHSFRVVRRYRVVWAAAAAVAAVLGAAWLVARMGEAGRVVRDGCAWIASHQEPDGSWNPVAGGGVARFRPALTALAALALMREPARYSQEIVAACAALERVQGDDGGFGPDDSGRMYNQALATWALLAAYDGGRQPQWKEPIDRSLAYIRTRQQPMGGWGYLGNGSDPANTAVTAWQVQVLARARQAGWPDQGGQLRKGVSWLRQRADPRGAFGYTEAPGDGPGGGTPTLNAMGAYTLLAARGAGDEMAADAKTLLAGRLRHESADARSVDADFYRAFFTVAAWEALGDRAQTGRLREGLCDKREKRGADKGSWAPVDPWGQVGGRLYTTSLAVLALQSRASGAL